MSGHEIDCLCTTCLRHDVEHGQRAGVLAAALVKAVDAVEKLTKARDDALDVAEAWMARAKASQAARAELVAIGEAVIAERDACTAALAEHAKEAARRFGTT